jgi:phosphatidate cytidylyltransferase
MPRNPFSDPLFVTVASRVGGALLVLLAGALFREWRRRRRPEERPLLVPVATAALLTTAFLLAIFAGGIVLIGFAAAIGLLGLGEYARITMLDRGYSALLAAWSTAGLLVSAFRSAYLLLLLLPIGLFLVATLIPIVSGRVDGAHRQVSGAMFGYVYIGLPMAYLVFIRSAEAWGLPFLLVVVAAAWLSDACGYTVGSKVKGPKLAPAVSPGKTWSGAAGSVLGAILGAALMRFTIPVSWSLAELVLLAAVIAVSAIWGDLIESFVKRDFKVKDAGVVLPGFGGVLDRFDSLLITIPIAYHVMLGGHYLVH